MDKAITTLEISTSAVKLVVGYELDGAPIVLYANKVFISEAIINSEIVIPEIIISAIKTLVSDAETNLEFTIREVVLALPSLDLQVFRGSQTTNTLTNKIDRIDVKNVLAMFRKSRVNPNQTIISVLPHTYRTENDKEYRMIPFGEQSNTLTVDALLHISPLWIYQTYIEIVQKAAIKVGKVYAGAYALSELLLFSNYATTSYYLVDFGAHETIISNVSSHTLFLTRSLKIGSNDLTEEIARAFGLDLNEAEKLKVSYGLDHRNINVKVTLAEGVDEEGNSIKVTLGELYSVIHLFMTNFLSKVFAEIKLLAQTQKVTNIDRYPIVFGGGGSQINGFAELLSETNTFNEKYIIKSTSIGARDLSYSVNLGLLKAYSKYILEVGDERSSVGTLTRG